MSIFTQIAIPMFCVSLTMFYLAHKQQDKNYLVPAYVLLAAGFVNTVIAVTTV